MLKRTYRNKVDKEIKEIREQYHKPLGFPDSVEEEMVRDAVILHRERITEQIVGILGGGGFNILQCEEILWEAQRRIKISTPVRLSRPNYQTKDCD